MSDAASKRWRDLSATTQWSTIFDLMCGIRDREFKIANYKGREDGGPVNKTKAVTANARDRALLDLLRDVTPAEVWSEAEKVVAGIWKKHDKTEAP